MALRNAEVIAANAGGFLGEPAQELGAVGDFAVGLVEGLAHLQGHHGREVVLVLAGGQLESAAQDLGALAGSGDCPVPLRLGSKVHGACRIFRRRIRNGDENLSGGGVSDVKAVTGGGLGELAVDEDSGGNPLEKVCNS